MKSSSDFLTVATLDYLDQALVTLKSAKKNASFSNHHLFLIDADKNQVDYLKNNINKDGEWISVFGPHDLKEQQDNFLRCFSYFNSLEICCYAKYVAIMHVLKYSITAETCVYSDSDIMFLSDPLIAIQEGKTASIILTPHQLKPSTGKQEQEFLVLGWINAGFFIVKKGDKSNYILSWLLKRISQKGFLAISIGLYVDQVWLSALPVLFNADVQISTHAGMNVAYWNLNERIVISKNDEFYVGNEKLIFFHFSGFIGARKGYLTKHCDWSIQAESEIEKLCCIYRRMLMEESAKKYDYDLKAKLLPCNKKIKQRMKIRARYDEESSDKLNIMKSLYIKFENFLSALKI
jgi:hypothetical protein